MYRQKRSGYESPSMRSGKTSKLYGIVLLLLLGILTGCHAKTETIPEQNGRLHLWVKESQRSVNICPSQLNGRYNGTICYDGVSDVSILINGYLLPLEQAVQENICSIEEVTAWAQADARNGICVERQCTYNGLTKFTYTYSEYMLIVIHGVYEMPDGNAYIINRFTVTLPKVRKTSPGSLLESGNVAYRSFSPLHQIPASGNRCHGAVGHGGGQLAYLFVAAVAGGEKAGGGGLHLVVCQDISLFVPGGKGG